MSSEYQGRDRRSGVTVSVEDMYRLLVKVDATVTAMAQTMATQTSTLTDHETRLRAVEAAEISARRVEAMETDVSAIREDIEGLKRRVYAIPAGATVLALVSLILVFAERF